SDGESFRVQYRISDPVGATSDSWMDFFVASDAVGHPPVARDDRAVVDDPELTAVTVPVLDNDSDPDGDVADLELSVVGSSATVVEGRDGQLAQLEIPLADKPQVVGYVITDSQGLTAHAVVRVPAAGEDVDLPPVWKASGACADEVELSAGRTEPGISFDGAEDPQVIDLGDCGFIDPEGGAVRFVSEQSLTSGVTGNLATKVEDGTRFTLSDSNGGKTPYTDVLTFVVTDAPGDETGNEVVVQIPVGVTATTDAAVNEPPTWPRTDSIEVTQDGEPSLPVDLTKLAKDPEGDDLSFEVEPGEGLSVEGDPSGGTLRLVGSKDLALGSGAAAVTVWADDGQEGHTPVKKELPVTGIKTNKAMPTLRPVPTVDDATRDERSTVNVLEGSTDPLGKGLEVISAEVGANPGQLSFDPGGEVSFTPAQVGAATVSFVVADDLDRRVAGTVTYSVAAPPGPPTTPQVLDFTYDSVTLRWGQAEDNASPIERYDVTSSPGGVVASCGTELSCTVDGLNPGTAYTFTVTATNEKGEGEPSPPSPPVTPDECPKAPQNASLAFVVDSNPTAGGQLVAKWAAPENNGTPISGYEITVDPGGQVLTPGAAATEQVISGLTNGVQHNVTIRARNRCEGEWGDEALAGPATPAGVPAAPTAVSATVIDDRVGGRVSLEWNAPSSGGSPSNNGDEVSEYTIREVSGRRQAETIQASQVSLAGSRATYELAVDRKQADLRFTVEANNKAGVGPASAASQAVSAPSAPTPPTITAAKATDDGTVGLDRKVRLTWNPPGDTGGPASLPISEYQYRIGSGGWQALAGDGLITGLTNGTEYRFQVRAWNGSYWSDPSAQSAAVTPYGPVSRPNVSSSRLNAQRVRFTWSPPSPATNGRPITSVRYRINSGGWVGTGESGSVDAGSGYNQTFTVTVRRCDSEGQCAERSVSKSTDAPPPPTISISWGDYGSWPGCAGCKRIQGSMANFPANTTVTIDCTDDVDGVYYSFNVTTDAAGNGRWGSSWCYWGEPKPHYTWVTARGYPARSGNLKKDW
ncbi:MAG: fibronectin type III domain-containing protein, partial [Microthrixaceae bacterium]|nr:fibronectin type III domain-containing protein [Microthrixaceae bacterium]